MIENTAKLKLLLFIHGIGGSAHGTWGDFKKLIEADAELAARYHVDFFEYGISPSLTEIAEALHGRMETDWAGFGDVTIIAHSQGGLVARRYIADGFKGQETCRVRRVLFFATPHGGTIWANIIGVTQNKQALGLARNSDQLQALYRDERDSDAHRRVETQYVVAADDRVVGKTSAWGSHGPGDYILVPDEGHGSIVKPTDPRHPGFRIARAFLIRQSAKGMVDADHRQPLLKQKWNEHQTEEETERNRFIYWARSIPFVGREPECAAIESFLETPSHRFAWMVMHGPGGMGKSRLALEVILAQLRSGWWYAGFLDDQHAGPDWTVWQPRLPTLIVIDYAASAPGQVAKLITALAERDPAHALTKPVRILLLEREAKDTWLGRITDRSAKNRDARMADLTLGALASPWPIFEHVWRQTSPDATPPDEEQTLTRFAELDPKQRPLFAMLMADAIARHGHERQWSKDALLNDVINRERENIWRPAAIRAGIDPDHMEKEERALTLATIMGGLPIDILKKDSVDLLPVWRRDAHRKLFDALSGIANDQIRSMEPDIVGEFHALTLLERRPDDAKDLTAMGWREAPQGAAVFAYRCAQDFPDHAALALTYRVPLETAETRKWWAALVSTLSTDLKFSDMAAARALYAELTDLAQAHPSEPELRLEQAQAAGHLIPVLGIYDMDAARTLYAELTALAQTYPSEPKLRLEQAKVFYYWITSIPPSKRATWAWPLYTELAALAATHPDEPELRLEQAKVAFSVISFHRSSDMAVVLTLYVELTDLAQAHPAEPKLRLTQAQAVVSLIRRLRASNMAKARALYDALAALARAHPAETELRLEQAQAAFNLIYHLRASDMADRHARAARRRAGKRTAQQWRGGARALYAELTALAHAHPAEPKLQEFADIARTLWEPQGIQSVRQSGEPC